MEDLAKTYSKEPDWATYYANTLAHEVYWLGLLAHWDDFFSTTNPLGANTTSCNKLVEIPNIVQAEINNAFE